MTASREAEIRDLVGRIDRHRIMHSGEPWQLLTAARDLLAELDRVRRLLPRQLALSEVG